MWENLSEQTRATLVSAGPPSSIPRDTADASLEGVIHDDVYLGLFWQYLYDNAGDESVLNLVRFLVENLTDRDEIATRFGPSGAMAAAFGQDLQDLLGLRAAGTPDREREQGDRGYAGSLTARLRADARATLDVWAFAFMDECFRICDADETAVTEDGDEGTYHSTRWVDIDVDFCDRVNEQLMKDMQPGDECAYVALRHLLLLGDDFPAQYAESMAEQSDFYGGRLTMVARGSGMSPGEIRVDGCTDPGGFKQNIRRFSKKKIDFV